MDDIREFLPDFGMTWRLFFDRRVSKIRKFFFLIFMGIGSLLGLVYILWPSDLIPAAALAGFGPLAALGALDDIAVPIILSKMIISWFIKGVPQKIVLWQEQHRWAESRSSLETRELYGHLFYLDESNNKFVVFDKDGWLRDARFDEEDGSVEVKDGFGRWHRFGGSDE